MQILRNPFRYQNGTGTSDMESAPFNHGESPHPVWYITLLDIFHHSIFVTTFTQFSSAHHSQRIARLSKHRLITDQIDRRISSGESRELQGLGQRFGNCNVSSRSCLRQNFERHGLVLVSKTGSRVSSRSWLRRSCAHP